MLQEQTIKSLSGKKATWETSSKLQDGNYEVKVGNVEIFQREINGELSWAATDQQNDFTLKSLISVGFPAKINRATHDVVLLERDENAVIKFSVMTVEKISRDGQPYAQKVYTKL